MALAYINERHGCNHCSTKVPTFVAGHHRYSHDMKSIYILAAIILVFSVSVLTVDTVGTVGTVARHSEKRLGLEAIDIILDPDVPFYTDTAFKLMDKLCGQVGDAMQGIVSGALNVDTGEFKTWDEYTDTEGQNPNQFFYFATGPWQTFYGECMLKPQSTWWEHSHESYGDVGIKYIKSAGQPDIVLSTYVSRDSRPQPQCLRGLQNARTQMSTQWRLYFEPCQAYPIA